MTTASATVEDIATAMWVTVVSHAISLDTAALSTVDQLQIQAVSILANIPSPYFLLTICVLFFLQAS